jgi:hypothetical protein
MKNRSLLMSLLLIMVAALITAPVPAANADEAAPATVPRADKAEEGKGEPGEEGEEKEEKWDVNNPPGDWKTITIDTEETTWSDVDVSPDGKTVIFDMLGDIYSVPIEGGKATAITAEIAWNFQPRFSPDGSEIAFISDRGGADNLWVMNADGSDPRAVTEEKMDLVHNPWWSPDGDYILAKKGFTSTRSIAAGEIWMFHVGGGGGMQITERPLKEKDQKKGPEDHGRAVLLRGRPLHLLQPGHHSRPPLGLRKGLHGTDLRHQEAGSAEGGDRHLRRRARWRHPPDTVPRREAPRLHQADPGSHQRHLPQGAQLREGVGDLRPDGP